MSTITAILEPNADGSLHLPLPEELRHGKVRVTATLEPAEDAMATTETERQRRLAEIMDRIQRRNPFQEIRDPAEWQSQMREDRSLPGRG